jgi:hypothetical protein
VRGQDRRAEEGIVRLRDAAHADSRRDRRGRYSADARLPARDPARDPARPVVGQEGSHRARTCSSRSTARRIPTPSTSCTSRACRASTS